METKSNRHRTTGGQDATTSQIELACLDSIAREAANLWSGSTTESCNVLTRMGPARSVLPVEIVQALALMLTTREVTK